nr:Os01g0313050 [Ipomoea batatas]
MRLRAQLPSSDEAAATGTTAVAIPVRRCQIRGSAKTQRFAQSDDVFMFMALPMVYPNVDGGGDKTNCCFCWLQVRILSQLELGIGMTTPLLSGSNLIPIRIGNWDDSTTAIRNKEKVGFVCTGKRRRRVKENGPTGRSIRSSISAVTEARNLSFRRRELKLTIKLSNLLSTRIRGGIIVEPRQFATPFSAPHSRSDSLNNRIKLFRERGKEKNKKSRRLFSSRSRGKESQSSNKGSIDVGRRLRLLIVIPVIGEVIPIIRAADDGSDEDVRIGRAGVEVLETIAATDPAGMLLHRRHRRAPVVNVLRILLTKPDHVRHSCRVVSEDVVHLFLRQRDEFVRRERRGPARHSAAVGV